jgi:FKBP-type peptidyl-prolyl cis-trans isomerase SlyD
VGFDLHFEGLVLEVRKATKDELAHGHVHDANKAAE